MLSNKLQYLARKNKKFLSRSSGSKGSRKEDQKGCFNCKKPGHFIDDNPDLQKEKSNKKSKKLTFKSNKFRKQMKKSLMVTWEDLDSESRSDKDEAGNEANVGVGLVATVTLEVKPDTDSEDENEVYSKIPREELIYSLKEFLTHFEHRTNELNDLKENYVDLMKQQEKNYIGFESIRGRT